MFILLPVFSVSTQFRRMLEMDRESVARDGRVERLIREIELEAQLVTVVPNRPVKIVDEKLRGYPGQVRSAVSCRCGHFISSTFGSKVSRWSLPCCAAGAFRSCSCPILSRAFGSCERVDFLNRAAHKVRGWSRWCVLL